MAVQTLRHHRRRFGHRRFGLSLACRTADDISARLAREAARRGRFSRLRLGGKAAGASARFSAYVLLAAGTAGAARDVRAENSCSASNRGPRSAKTLPTRASTSRGCRSGWARMKSRKLKDWL